MTKNLNDIKKTGFKTPEDYFNNLEGRIFDNIKIDEALKDVESTGFDMPNGYLNTIEDAVFSKLPSTNNTKVVSLFSRRNLIYFSGVAAAVLLFFSLFFNSTTTTFDNIDVELVENYIINENIDSYEIAALLTDEDLVEDAFFENTIMDEDLENYILDNTTIEDLLIE